MNFALPNSNSWGFRALRLHSLELLLDSCSYSAVVLTIEETWVAATLCLAFGLTVQIPGALAIKSWRWFRNSIGN